MPQHNRPARKRNTIGDIADGPASPERKKKGGPAARTRDGPFNEKTAEITREEVILCLKRAANTATSRKQPAAATTSATALARLAGFYKDQPGPDQAAQTKFDGNYVEAARRVALLLRLGEKQKAAADESANGRKP